MALGKTKRSAPADYMRDELRDKLLMYELIDDALNGTVAVKKRRSRYLPIPNAADNSTGNKNRYEAYITRAVFYNVTRATRNGFIGELFSRDPVITIPKVMETLIEDCNGEGVGIIQICKRVTADVLAKGRAGLFTDYPTTAGATTAADLAAGVRPVIKTYRPLQIINWRYKKVGAQQKLSLVVLEEPYDKSDDGYLLTKGKQWRVLRLDDANHYNQALYRDTSGNQPVLEDGTPGSIIYPTDAAGKVFEEIPFAFIGSETNDAEVDYPPLYDMADLNIAHYRNSADYEEAVYICGQPTPVITGLTEQWADKYFKEGVGLGSRAALPLPIGASAELLQAAEVTLPGSAMEQKERQMVAIGAKLVEQRTVQRTATETATESASEKSVLATIADNVSVAFEWALGWAAQFAGVPEEKIVFRVNKEFSIAFSSPESRTEVIDAWIKEAISFTEMRSALRRGGIATLPDEQAKKEIDKDRDTSTVPLLDDNGDPADPTKTPSPQPAPKGDPIQANE